MELHYLIFSAGDTEICITCLWLHLVCGSVLVFYLHLGMTGVCSNSWQAACLGFCSEIWESCVCPRPPSQTPSQELGWGQSTLFCIVLQRVQTASSWRATQQEEHPKALQGNTRVSYCSKFFIENTTVSIWMKVPLYFQILRLPLYLLDEVVKINYKLTWK